ncbi:MAG: PASTA domain-containing protein [Firmicutes bacterium]|nr:PASTA domain-containing protein [Bacillota bacterium]MBQ9604212.1 PASTA domain-containing protein [Bacillota bacterium]
MRSEKNSRKKEKNDAREASGNRIGPKRTVAMMLMFVAVIIFIGIGRVTYIKMTKGVEYEAQLVNQLVSGGSDKTIVPSRGAILDSTHQPLALSSTVYNVILDVRLMVSEHVKNTAADKKDSEKEAAEEKWNRTLETLNTQLGIPMETLTSYLVTDAEGKPAKDTNYLILAKKVPFAKGQAISALGYSWVYCESDNQRTYPQEHTPAQVVGFMSGDNGESSWGLESYYNTEMTGLGGREFRSMTDDSNVVTNSAAAIDGYNLVTTIDSTLQQYADEACRNAYVAYEPENTACIIMNPKTGAILAMSQYPTFDPNQPTNLAPEVESGLEKTWARFEESKKAQIGMEFDAWKNYKSWRNFSITETYEPGSIYKPIVAAMALEEGVISPNETFNCPGVKVIADYEIHCHNVDGHGTISLEEALADSCNVALMEMITKLGAEKYYKYHKAFGYGEKTGIDLPGEVSANSPALSYSLEQLHSAELATSSFGQGFNATALQSLNALCATINGGNLMQPYVVSQIVDANGGLVKENKPHVIRKVISKGTSDIIRKYLESVVQPTGTGRKAVINGYAIGGKTGTAEQGVRGSNEYTLSFIAYLPVEDPDIIAMTVIHRPPGYYDGSDISPVPMLRDVLVKIIDYKGYQPSYEVNVDESDTPANDRITLGDYTNTDLAETVKQLNSRGISYELIGNGDTVFKQNPPAGTAINKDTSIILNISSSGNKELTAVPDVVGLDADDAASTIEAMGFSCYVENSSDSEEEETYVDDEDYDEEDEDEDYDEDEDEEEEKPKRSVSVGKGQVYAQVPGANVKISQDTPVKIKID